MKTFRRKIAEITGSPDKCWLWKWYINKGGYGKGWANSKKVYAHRAAYELFVGPIPDGLVIDHLCRTRNCVNPAHLEPVTRGENVLRGETISAKNAARSHCKHGHPYSTENTLVFKKKGRVCRTCSRDGQRKRNQRPEIKAARSEKGKAARRASKGLCQCA